MLIFPYLGELSAIGAALTWSACALIFTAASHRMASSFSMNHYKTTFGMIILIIIQLVVTGTLIPHSISLLNWSLLALSGVIGYFLADASLYQSYMTVGPRLGILIFNFYPLMSTVLAWLFLKEALSIYALFGITVTLAGIVWVVAEKSEIRLKTHKKHFSRGIFFAITAGLMQAISFTIVKPVMTGGDPVDPLTTTVIRAIFGCSAYWIISLFRGKVIVVLKKTADKKAMALIGFGALIGSSVGVLLAMIAVKMAPVGIASTLMALMPIMVLPMVAIINKEKLSARAIVGTIIACLGVAILFNV